jgi:type III secretion system FlhB-like substrate exporter
MKNTVLLISAIGFATFALMANKKEQTSIPDSIDIIIEKSNQTMRQASEVSAKADQQVASKINEMKETIEVLAEEKTQLVQQVKMMEDEIITIKSASVQPFDVLAIGVSDSTSRK